MVLHRSLAPSALIRRCQPVTTGPDTVNQLSYPAPTDRQGRPNRPLRVLLMIASMDGGGSEQQTLLLLKHLDRSRFAPELYLLRRTGSLLSQVPQDVPIHSFDDLGDDDERQRDPSGLSVQGVKYVRSWRSLVLSRLGALCRSFHFSGKIHRAQVRDVAQVLSQRQIDVVYDRTFLMTLIAAPAAAKLGVPRVSTIVSPPSGAVPLLAGRYLVMKRRLLRTAYRSAAAVIAVSRPVAKDAAAYYGLPRRRFIVVPNPVDAQALDATVAAAPKPPRDERWTIACVGRISIEKGQTELLDALDQLRRRYPDFPLPRVWMIGDGPLRAELEQTAKQLNLEREVEFLGHLSQPAPWIAAADALCLPSHFEGFPNVMLEAMALGIPVIARGIAVTRSLARLSQRPELRGRDYLAMFQENPSSGGVDLARKIRRVRLNTAATASRVGAARRLAREEHAIIQLVPRIENLLVKAYLDSWQTRAGS
jgi:glycosyltransferase involved in cell wall biosynthesis